MLPPPDIQRHFCSKTMPGQSPFGYGLRLGLATECGGVADTKQTVDNVAYEQHVPGHCYRIASLAALPCLALPCLPPDSTRKKQKKLPGSDRNLFIYMHCKRGPFAGRCRRHRSPSITGTCSEFRGFRVFPGREPLRTCRASQAIFVKIVF